MKNCQPCARRAKAWHELVQRHPHAPIPKLARAFLERKAATLDRPREEPASREASAVEEAR